MYQRCICGKFFKVLTAKQKYCSDECRPKNSYYKPKELIKKNCVQCGRPFTTRREKQRFCSRHCRELFHQIEKRWHEKICRNCEKPFKTSKEYQHYCSEKCYRIAKRKRDALNLKRIRDEANKR